MWVLAYAKTDRIIRRNKTAFICSDFDNFGLIPLHFALALHLCAALVKEKCLSVMHQD